MNTPNVIKSVFNAFNSSPFDHPSTMEWREWFEAQNPGEHS